MIDSSDVAKIELFQPIAGTGAPLYPYLSTARGLSAWHADEVDGDVTRGHFTLRWPTLHAELTLRVLRYRMDDDVVLQAGDSIVTLQVVEGGIKLVHDGLSSADDLDGFRSSWALALSLLSHSVTNHPAERRRVYWCFETLTLSHELAHFYFSSAHGLRKWLGEASADMGLAGTAVRLKLGDEFTLTGTVLAHEPGRDLAVSWSELEDSVLVLRTLPAADHQRTLSLSLSSWDGGDRTRVMAYLNGALRRLREAAKNIGQS